MAIDGVLSHFTRWPGLKILDLDTGWGVATWGDLLPLLSCRNVEELSLGVMGSGAMLKDEHIELMAKAWPQTRSFTIRDPILMHGNRIYPSERPVATIRGLTSLAQHFPLLHTLSISKVTGLNLHWSLADLTEVEDVAILIATMWPDQKRITRMAWLPYYTAEYKLWRRIWAVVDVQLGRV